MRYNARATEVDRLSRSAARKLPADNQHPSPLPHPFLKWAGGKSQLLDRYALLYPPPGSFRRYVEPFVGSGAVFFHVRGLLRARKVLLADGNPELINVYRCVRDDVESLIARLAKHQRRHSEEHYYEVRDQDPAKLDRAQAAARLIYLNRTCFNGLYRVNRHGRFNVPMGSYENPRILDAQNLRAASEALHGVRLKLADFRDMLGICGKGDFVYFDPPYQPLSPTSSFTSYATRNGRAGFDEDDQRELAEAFTRLARRGCRVMLSNSDTPFIRRLYRRFRICGVSARRAINSRAERRGAIPEVVVLSYEPPGSDWTRLLVQV